MALNAYLTIEGETQGPILGSVTQAGRQDKIEVYAWNWEMMSLPDAATGLPSESKTQRPVVMTKAIDKSTPLLLTAQAESERLTLWTLEFYRPSPTGAEAQYFTVRLTNAQVIGVRMEMLNNKYPENMHHQEREHIYFHYENISAEWVEGGLATADIPWSSGGA